MHKMRKLFSIALFTVGLFLGMTSQSMAVTVFDIAGKPLYVMGYLNQGVQFGITGDHYDTQKGFQQALTQFLLEMKYVPSENVTAFVSGNLNFDWAYPILRNDSDWTDKRFDKSRNKLMVFDEFETMLKEAHITYTAGDFVFRVGKQIVVWGETDGVRLLDQINPQDNRRGISDVKFETTIIPIWLLKAEYFPKWMQSSLISDFAAEFIFNPNLQFIGNKNFGPGNDEHGIWGLDLVGPGVRIGSFDSSIDEPSNGSSEGYEYGVRLKSNMLGSIFTLNYFYGLENNPVSRNVAPYVRLDNPMIFDDSERLLIHPIYEGYYPRQHFVGASIAREIPWLRASFLGGVAPVFRVEAQYVFDRTFITNGKDPVLESFEKYDEIRYAVGLDWKIKVPILNPTTAFSVYAQFVQEHISGYPKTYALYEPGIIPVAEDNYTTSLTLTTNYFHGQLTPTFFWQRQYKGSQKGDLFIAKLAWKFNDKYSVSVQGTWMEKALFAELGGMDNKDNVDVVFSYTF
jgi:hypothetical protein